MKPDVFKRLSILDRLLTPAILVTMIVGVLIGEYVPTVQAAFDTARFEGVSSRAYSYVLRGSSPLISHF